MLKACWDCVAGTGALRNGAENEGSYGIQLNGNSQRAPLRPGERNMFVVPRPLNDGDTMVVSGTMNNPERFTTNLLTGSPSPDYNNIACQLEANFPSSTSNENGITLRIIERGQSEVINGSYLGQPVNGMMSGSTFEFRFKFEIINGMAALTIFINGSILEQAALKHDIETITFLELRGDVNVTGLAFQFV